jgi:biotin-(acetyl-CoA carboxylase) ligase
MSDNIFNQQQIQYLLKQFLLDKYRVTILDKVDSTQNYAMQNLENLASNSVIVAEEQTVGRGRNGKVWTAKPCIDITASFIYKFALDFEYDLLPLVIAIAVNRLFKHLRVVTKIKWPNDILLPDKTKIAGVLIESKVCRNDRYLIIGIGIDNINSWNRNNLLVSLIQQVNNILSEYQIFGFATIRREWLDNCIHCGSRISLIIEGK